MQIGDLVELSAQGYKLCWLRPVHNRIGILMQNHGNRYRVHWFGPNEPRRAMAFQHTIARKSIKHASSER